MFLSRAQTKLCSLHIHFPFTDAQMSARFLLSAVRKYIGFVFALSGGTRKQRSEETGAIASNFLPNDRTCKDIRAYFG